jgi:hypothetical protein
VGFLATPNTIEPPWVLAMAEYDVQKLPGMPTRADLNLVSMPSVLDCRADKRSLISLVLRLLDQFFQQQT